MKTTADNSPSQHVGSRLKTLKNIMKNNKIKGSLGQMEQNVQEYSTFEIPSQNVAVSSYQKEDIELMEEK